ncbi:MAG: magnesium transporter [Chloroflexota bacterium]
MVTPAEARLHEDLVVRLRVLSTAQHPERTATEVRRLLDRLPNRAVAEALLALSDQELAALLFQLTDDIVAELIAELAPTEGARLLLRLTHARAADVLGEMAPDDAADLVAALGRVDRQAEEDILVEMQPREAGDVRGLLAYPEDSAGGVMTTRVATVRPDMTAEQALAAVRRLAAEERAETIYYLYVIDDQRHLLGVLSLRELVLAPPGATVSSIMRRDFAAVRPQTDQEAVARLLTEKHLLALPVVDEAGRLLGIVTVDDVADVLVEETTEDIYRLAGVYAEEEHALSPLRHSLRARVPWLMLNLLTAFLAASVVAPFEDTISRVAALAVFMPVIAGHGGNTGTQVATIVVRSLALGTVTLCDVWRVVRKEVAFGLVHGALAGLLCAAFALLLDANPWLALVVVLAMVGNVVMAGLVGSLIPLALRRLGQDPALASAIWLTTFTDMFGFFLLLGSGTLLVQQLT